MLSAILLLVGTILVSMGVSAAGENLYKPIFDYEGEGGLTSNKPAQMLGSLETVQPLGGLRSQKFTFSDAVVDPIAYNDAAPGAGADDFTGFVLRLKTQSAKQGLFRLSSGSAFFTKKVVFVDTEGRDVTDTCADVPGKDFVSVPENFDGYIFLPFSGEFAGAAFNANTETIPLLAWFYGDGWNGAQALLDDVGYYKGENYDEILAAMPKPTKLYQQISGFEDGQFFGGNSMGNTPLSMEDGKPLSGERSLKVTTKGEAGQNRLWADGVKGAPGFDGLVMRMKTNASAGAALGIVPRHGADVWPSLGDGVTFLDMEGNDVTAADSSLGDAVRIPEKFDGYLFLPFAGDRTKPAITSDMNFNLLLHMYACSTWGDEVIFDDFGFYRGAPKSVVGQMPPPNDNVEYPNPTGQNSHVLFDFEAAESVPFGYDENAGVAVTVDKTGALKGHGSRSVKMDLSGLPGDLAFPLVTNMPDAKPVGFDGFLLRVKTDAAAPFHLEVYATQKGAEIMMTANALLLNANGRRVPAQNTATGVTLPAGFDGYVAVPFAPQFLSKSAYVLYVKFSGTAELKNSVTYLDTLAYYKGGKYQEIIEELAPGSIDYTPEDNDPTVPTGTVSHKLMDFESAELVPKNPDNPEGKDTVKQGENVVSPGPEMTLSVEKDAPLHGSRSLKVEVGKLSAAQPWTFLDLELPTEKPADFDGLMLGIRTDAFENAILGMWIRTESGAELYPTNFGGCLYTRKGRLVTKMDPAIDTGWNGFYLPDRFDGFAFFPFPKDFTGEEPYHIIIAMVGTSNFTDSTTLLDSFGYYKGDDYPAVIEEVAPGSMEGGEDPEPEGEAHYNKTYDVRLSPFIEGVIPSSAILDVQRVDVTDDHILALQALYPDARLCRNLALKLMDTRGKDIELNVPVELTFGIPYGMSPLTTRILELLPDGALREQEVTLADMTTMSFYATSLGTYVLADNFEMLDGELTDLWRLINTKGEQDTGGEPPGDGPGGDSPETGVTLPPALPATLCAAACLAGACLRPRRKTGTKS